MMGRISEATRELIRAATDPTQSETKQVTLRLRPGLVEDLDRLAREAQTSRTSVIETILETVLYEGGAS